jgi:fructoselysine 6-kinase
MVVGIGDNCIDHYLPPVDRKFAGGNVLNVVANCLRHGYDALYVGSVGDDAHGLMIQNALAALGGHRDYLDVVPGGATGVTTVQLTSGGETLVMSESYGVSAHPPLIPALLNDLAARRPLVHLATTGDAVRVAETVASTGSPLACDFGNRWQALSARARAVLLPRLRYAFLSVGPSTPVAAVHELAAAWAADGPRRVLITRGAAGCVALWDGHWVEEAAEPLDGPLVDTLGAGDAFIAGVLTAALDGAGGKDAVRRGLVWAAEACRRLGAF